MKIIFAMFAGVFLGLALKLLAINGLIPKTSPIVQFAALTILLLIVEYTLKPLISERWTVIILVISCAVGGILIIIGGILDMLGGTIAAVIAYKYLSASLTTLFALKGEIAQIRESEAILNTMALLTFVLIL